MALQQTVTMPGGVTLTDAYHRIQRTDLYAPTAEGSEPSFSVEVAVYRDAQARGDGLAPVYVQPFSLPIPADPLGNLIQQGYAALKALPDYAGAQDV